jgi:hypothetical protein
MQRRLERRRSILCCTVFFPQALGLPKKLDSFYSRCVSWIPGPLIGCPSSRKFKEPTGEFDGVVYGDGKSDPLRRGEKRTGEKGVRRSNSQ